MSGGKTHTGGCLCGAVRYRVGGPSVWKAICYCETCTRAAGAPAIAWAGIAKSRFRLLKGSIETYESTPGVLRGFCRRCGTTLTYRKDPEIVRGARDDVYIATRTLDDPDAYPPDEHVFYGERVGWFDAEDDRPHHDGVSADYKHLQLLTLTAPRD
jgi:hypothetical protein